MSEAAMLDEFQLSAYLALGVVAAAFISVAVCTAIGVLSSYEEDMD